MTLFFLFLSSGIIAAGYLPWLPPLFYLLFIVPFFFFLKKIPLVIIPCAFLLGMGYSVLSGYHFLENQLDTQLVAKDLVVEGKVVNLPIENDTRQLFEFDVSNAYFSADKKPFAHFPKKINIASYDELRVKPGEHWRLLVKLKKPRGFVNPGGFDYQVSLLRRGVGATGYIRSSPLNKMMHPQPDFSMDKLRYDLQQWLIQKSSSPEKGILIALLVGDTSLIDKLQWGEMQKTGLTHLIAISGLHLGFFAIVGFFAGNFMGRFVQLCWHRCPAMVLGHVCAISFTIFYSIIAGLNIPTLRTLIMLGVVQWVYVWRRSFRGRDTLLLALVLVLLYDPLASFDIGFWLSFGAVAILILYFSGRIRANHHLPIKFHIKMYVLQNFIEFIKSQWVMFVGLLVPLALLVHTTPLLAPVANFIAIPLVTFFVVPCLIVAAIGHFTFGIVETFFLHCAEYGALLLHHWVQFLLAAKTSELNPLVNFNGFAIFLASLSVFILLLPRGLGNKYIGIAGLTIATVIPLNKLPALQVLVFDVGQGTAVLVRTPHHQLLYDTGPLYTENFDAGSALIVPYLSSQGLRHLDRVVVSHNDQDHSGGLVGVLASTQVDELLLGEPEKYHADVTSPPVYLCHSIEPWQWDQVNFRFITWPLLQNDKANNHSCVLEINYSGHKILLTGDIEKQVERQLVNNNSLTKVDVLLAPHHGSHTSSTVDFVERTSPGFVVYSAGYHNQHGHPHQDIRERYQAIHAQPFNTAFSGALDFSWDKGELIVLREYRTFSKRYWFDGEQE